MNALACFPVLLPDSQACAQDEALTRLQGAVGRPLDCRIKGQIKKEHDPKEEQDQQEIITG